MRLLQADYVDYIKNIRQNCGTNTEQQGTDLVTGTTVWATISPTNPNSPWYVNRFNLPAVLSDVVSAATT